jgi:hemerythrin
MMLAGEESLKMLIRKPSEQLIDFIKSHLDDEDAILVAIPRFDMPKSDFESQVLREMRLVLRDNTDKITDKCSEELMKWNDFETLYHGLENFDYPHKDKLLDFIKYFFLDHIESADLLQMNY